jgi:hypothetical protein
LTYFDKYFCFLKVCSSDFIPETLRNGLKYLPELSFEQYVDLFRTLDTCEHQLLVVLYESLLEIISLLEDASSSISFSKNLINSAYDFVYGISSKVSSTRKKNIKKSKSEAVIQKLLPEDFSVSFINSLLQAVWSDEYDLCVVMKNIIPLTISSA